MSYNDVPAEPPTGDQSGHGPGYAPGNKPPGYPPPPLKDPPPPREPLPPRHLRVGILVTAKTATVSTVWVVDEPAVLVPVVAEPIISRVDIAGRIGAVQTHGDPLTTRSTVQPEFGHHYGQRGQGLVYLSVPFATVTDLARLRVRVLQADDALRAGRELGELAGLFDDPSPGASLIADLTVADFAAAPEWPAVAGGLGLPVDAGWFEIYRGRDNRFRWRLRRANGLIVADSGQGYLRRDDCESDLAWVKAHAAELPVRALDVEPPGEEWIPPQDTYPSGPS